MTAPLWTIDELIAATGGRLDGAVTGPSAGFRSTAAASMRATSSWPSRANTATGTLLPPRRSRTAPRGHRVAARAGDARQPERCSWSTSRWRRSERLGAAARARSKARIVGVTGSVGKTSSKEALRLALSASGPTHASASSYNNQWGVPLSLARLPRDAAYRVFEIGMSQAGEITPLTRLVRPHVAIVTTIAASHLGISPRLRPSPMPRPRSLPASSPAGRR
jgi:UDP-N-acetylmuramoyl-tripeptide--D-alanyl-D-alanine ligase